MRLFSLTRKVPAPVSDVYATLLAVDLLPEWASSVESVELIDPLPIGEGTRFRETRRHNDRETTVEMTVSELVPDNLIEISAVQGNALVISTWHLEPATDGTTVHFEMNMVAERLVVRLIVRVLTIFMRGVMRRCIEDDLDDLTRFLNGDDGDAHDRDTGDDDGDDDPRED